MAQGEAYPDLGRSAPPGWYVRLLALLSLRPGEVARAVLAFLYLFLIIASYLLVKAIRNALFISEFGALKLPYVMLGIAVLTGVLVSVYIRLARRIPTARLTVHTLLFFAGNVLLFWWLAAAGWKWLCPILYVWSGVFGVIATTQVWTLANDLFTVREAKRVFGVVGSGGILGAAVGGSVAYRLASRVGTPNLLLVVVGLLLAAAAIVACLVRLRTAQVPVSRTVPPPKNLRESIRVISRSGHLRLLAGLVFVTALATTTVDFQFNVVAADAISDRDALTAFFGAVYGGTSVLAFLLQIAMTSRFLAHVGVGASLLLLPLSLLSGTSALVLTKAVWAGVLLKGSDGALKHSLDRSCRELMYLPVSPHVKVQTKSTIDTVLDRAGDGTAGAVQLALVEGLEFGLPASLAVNLAVVAIWIAMAIRLRHRYVDELRRALGDPGSRPGAIEALAEDADARRTVERVLERGSDAERLAALEWAALAGAPLDERLLLKLAHGEASSSVRRAALAALLRGSDADLPTEALAPLEEEGQAALVAAIDVVVEEDRSRVVERFEALAGRTGETARLALLAFAVRRLGPGLEPFAAKVFDAILAPEAPPRTRRAAVAALGLLPDGSEPLARLGSLLGDEDGETAAAAARVAASRGRADLLPALLILLGRPGARAAARQAIVSFGTQAAASAAGALRDPATPDAVRRRIPGLLTEIATPGAVEALVQGLRHPDPVTADRCLVALGAIRRRNPSLSPVRAGALAEETIAMAERGGEALRTRRSLARAGGGADGALGPLLEALDTGARRALDAVFGLLALEYDPEDMAKVGRAIRDGSPAEASTGFELLANVLPRPLERRLLAILETGRALPGGARGAAPPEVPAALRRLACGPDPWIAAAALHAARRIGATGMTDAARRALESHDPAVREEAEALLRAEPAEGRTMGDRSGGPERMTGVERAIALRGSDAFRSVPMDQLVHVAAVAREERYAAGEVLFREGEPPGGLIVVLEGVVRLDRGGAAAGEAGAGEALGTWSLFDDHPRRATAAAATDARVLVLDREAFFDVLSERIEIVRSLFRDLAHRLIEPAGAAGREGR